MHDPAFENILPDTYNGSRADIRLSCPSCRRYHPGRGWLGHKAKDKNCKSGYISEEDLIKQLQKQVDKLDFKKLNILYNEADNHLSLINLKDSLENNAETNNLLNVALEDVLFTFRKVSEEEMVIADKLKNTLKRTREEMVRNFDKNDKEFIALYEELRRLFEKKNLDEITQEEMNKNIHSLEKIYEAIKELNRKNNLLKSKYSKDEKFARLHKRIREEKNVDTRETLIFEALNDVKKQADQKVLDNSQMVQNEEYFIKFMSPIVISNFENHGVKLDNLSAERINKYATAEYLYEYNNTTL